MTGGDTLRAALAKMASSSHTPTHTHARTRAPKNKHGADTKKGVKTGWERETSGGSQDHEGVSDAHRASRSPNPPTGTGEGGTDREREAETGRSEIIRRGSGTA